MNRIVQVLFQAPLIFTQILTLLVLCYMLFKNGEWIKKKRYGYLSVGCFSVLALIWLSITHTRAFLCKPAIIGPTGSVLYAGMHTCTTHKMDVPAYTPVLISDEQEGWCKVIIDSTEGWVPSTVLIKEK